MVGSVVAELERRVPNLAQKADAAARDSTLGARPGGESQEALVKHKDLEKWFGAGL